MPQFDQLSLQEAMQRTAKGSRARTTQEYLGYIEQVTEGHSGRLRPSGGETVAAVRRRLGQAAKLSGKEIIIRRSGDEVYFWQQPQAAKSGPRKRGRARRSE